MARLTASDIVHRYEALESERENLDGQLELLERFVMPGKGKFFEEGHDEEETVNWRHREVYDGTAYNSCMLLAANVHSALTSSASTWFELRFREDELNDDREASAWLEECAKRMRAGLNDSNFDMEVSEFYQDGVGFGTSIMLHNEADGPGVQWNGHRFKTEMLRQCYFEEDSDGRPTALFIKRNYTAMQLALKFGKASLPQRIVEHLDNPSAGATDKREECIHCIYLDVDKAKADVSRILPVSSRPYVGRWVLTEGREFLGAEQGFYELPGYVLRWARTAGSKYGHCPGMIALGDILTLQEMVEMVRTATEKSVDPPMKTERRGVLGDIELQAGGITSVRGMDSLMPLMPPGAYRVETGWTDINDMRQRIERMFFVDQLQLKESPRMTATEVQVRYEMMQRLLGPTLGRIQSDFLDPLIERTFWMMYRKGALPEMPDSVQGAADLDIEYVGPLARAQKMSAVDGIERWVAGVGNLAQVYPDALDVPDFDEVSRQLAEILGVPAKLLRSEADIRKLREQRQQAQQAQAMVEQAQGVAKAAKDASQADFSGVAAGAPGPGLVPEPGLPGGPLQ